MVHLITIKNRLGIPLELSSCGLRFTLRSAVATKGASEGRFGVFFQIVRTVFLFSFLVVKAPPKTLTIRESFIFTRLRRSICRWRFYPGFSLDLDFFDQGLTREPESSEDPGTRTIVVEW